MHEAYGNLWNIARGAVLCITTNGVVRKDGAAVMGRGIALEAARRFPRLPYRLGDYLTRYGNRAFYLGKWGEYQLVSFPTKQNWKDPSSLALIEKSAKELVAMANKFMWEEVYLPRPGCGNGQLEWTTVKAAIQDILDDRFIVVTR